MRWVVLTALAAMVATLALASQAAGPAAADSPYTQREIVTYQNTTGITATDFHIKFWQKEDSIEVVGWAITGEVPPLTDCVGVRGDQPDESLPGIGNPHANGDNGMHAVDVTCDNFIIPDGGSLTFYFEWTLTAFNTKREYGIEWTHEGQDPSDAGPDHGWAICDPAADPNKPGEYGHELWLWNDDPVHTLTVGELKIGSDPSLLSFVALDSFNTWDWVAPAPFDLSPGGARAVTINTTGDNVGGSIVALYTVKDGPDVIIQDKLAHEVPPAGSSGVPCGFPAKVGGVAELAPGADVSAQSGTPADGSGWSTGAYAGLAAGLAAAAIAMTAGAWYTRRRWLR